MKVATLIFLAVPFSIGALSKAVDVAPSVRLGIVPSAAITIVYTPYDATSERFYGLLDPLNKTSGPGIIGSFDLGLNPFNYQTYFEEFAVGITTIESTYHIYRERIGLLASYMIERSWRGDIQNRLLGLILRANISSHFQNETALYIKPFSSDKVRVLFNFSIGYSFEGDLW